MVRCMMTLILSVGRIMKCMTEIILCLIPLNKILDKLYIWLSDTTNVKRDLVEVNNIFLSHIMDVRGGLFRAKEK